MSARLYRGPKTTRPTRSIVVKAKAEIKRLDAPRPLPAYELAYEKPMYDKAWPLTEDDIDLPTEAPPELPSDPDAPVVIATLNAAMRLGSALDPIDLELRFAKPDAIEIGPMIFPFAQVLKLQRHLDEILDGIRASIVMTARPSSEVR